MIFWCDRLMYFSILALMASLPFAKAGVKIASGLAILFFLLKKAAQLKQALALPAASRSPALREACILPFRAAASEYGASAYLAVCFLSLFLTHFFKPTFRAFFGKTLEVIFLFIIVQEVLNSPRRIRWFLGIFVTAAVVLSLDAFGQLAFGRDLIRGFPLLLGRVCATMKHPNDLAAYLINIILPVGVMAGGAGQAFFKHKSWGTVRPFLLWAGVLLVVIGCLDLTYSRGAWCGLIVASVVFLAFQPQRWKVFVSVFALALMVFMLMLVANREDVRYTYTRQVDVNKLQAFAQDSGRNIFWKDAVTIFKEHPVVGTGLNTYTEAKRFHGGMSGYYAHNCYLQMAAELGLIGVAAFLGFMISILVTGARRIAQVVNKKERALLYAFLASWAGLMAHGAVDTTFYSSQHWPLIWMMAGFLMVAPAVLKQERLD